MLWLRMRNFSVPSRSSFRTRAFKSYLRMLHRYNCTGTSCKSSKCSLMDRLDLTRLFLRWKKYLDLSMSASESQHWGNSSPKSLKPILHSCKRVALCLIKITSLISWGANYSTITLTTLSAMIARVPDRSAKTSLIWINYSASRMTTVAQT